MNKAPYQAKNYEHLIGTPGFSEKLLKAHFKLYEAYVKNTNDLLNSLALAGPEDQKHPRFSEMRRRFGWEFNGMRLHEVYFDNLARDPAPPPADGALAKRISEEFGSFEDWKKRFTGIGAMRGIGWVALVHDGPGDRLLNVWIDEHDTGHLAGAPVLLVMDVFEHAFIADYGLEKDKYIASFWNAIHWTEVSRRYEAALNLHASHA